jgi:hypothetical protein
VSLVAGPEGLAALAVAMPDLKGCQYPPLTTAGSAEHDVPVVKDQPMRRVDRPGNLAGAQLSVSPSTRRQTMSLGKRGLESHRD